MVSVACMCRTIGGIGLALCLTGAAVLARPQQPVFEGEGDTVRVFVTVTDGDGRLVTSLTKDDFEIRDGGRPQPITLFDNTPQPIQLVVMLDVSGSMVGNLDLLRASAESLIARLAFGDRVRVGTFGGEIGISPSFTSDPDELRAALPLAIAADAPTPLWLALDEALDAFDAASDARRVVLVLSDGRDSGSVGFGRRSSSQIGVIDEARERDAMVYAIGMRSRGPRGAGVGVGAGSLRSMLAMDLPDPGLARVAEQTGGGYLELRGGDDLGAAFAEVADELHRQYLLGFAPPERDGKVHRIEVRVRPRGMTPRARRDYVAPDAR